MDGPAVPVDGSSLIAAFDALEVAISVFAPDLRLVYANESFHRTHHAESGAFPAGTTFEEIVGRVVGIVNTDEPPDSYCELCQRARDPDGVAREVETSDGQVFRYRLVPLEDGNMMLTLWNITARRQSERLATERSDQLEAILQHVPHGIAYLDQNGDLALGNDAFYGSFDFPADQGPGTPDFVFTRQIVAKTTTLSGAALNEAAEQRLARIDRECEDGAVSSDVERLTDGKVIEIRRRRTPQGHLVSTYVDITEREKALETAIRLERLAAEKSAQLETILRETGEGIVIFDPDLRLVLMNDGYVDMIVSPESSVVSPGSSMLDMSRSRIAREQGLTGESLEAAARRRVEETVQSARDGKPRLEPIKDGRIAEVRRRRTSDGFLVGIFTDVTERVQRAEDLQSAVQRFRAVVEDQTEMICRFDREHRLTFVNNAYCDAFGKPRAELEGSSFLDLIVDPGARTAIVEGLAGLTPEDPILRGTYQERASDGSTTWQTWVNRALFDEIGALKEYQAVGRDVTAEREMHEALARSERHFKDLTEAHPVPIVIFDRETDRIIHASPPAIELLAPGRATLEGLSSTELVCLPEERRRFLDAIDKRGRISQMEMLIETANGDRVAVEVTARQIEFEGREAVVCGVVDISERKMAEAEIARQRDALAQSEKMSAMGSLLASVSHELNNPLSIIVGQSQLLQTLAKDPKVAKRAERVRTAAERCARIVRTFLSMARQREPSRSPVPVNSLVRNGVELAHYTLSTSGIDLNIELAEDEPVILGDEDQLMQVIVNLLINAQQALVEQEGARRLCLRTSSKSDQVIVEIVDNGPGVPAEIRDSIFEPFFTTKPEGVGTGIGLAVCRNIVEAHGGGLTVGQSEDGGAHFLITLPANQGDAVASPGNPTLPTQWQSLPLLSILVADDESEIAETAREILEIDGHKVHIAANGREALETLGREDVDIILSDLRMPILDGPGLWTEIERQGLFPLERIGFITGDTLGVSVRRFLESAEAPVIEKPFQGDELKQLILDILDREV